MPFFLAPVVGFWILLGFCWGAFSHVRYVICDSAILTVVRYGIVQYSDRREKVKS